MSGIRCGRCLTKAFLEAGRGAACARMSLSSRPPSISPWRRQYGLLVRPSRRVMRGRTCGAETVVRLIGSVFGKPRRVLLRCRVQADCVQFHLHADRAVPELDSLPQFGEGWPSCSASLQAAKRAQDRRRRDIVSKRQAAPFLSGVSKRTTVRRSGRAGQGGAASAFRATVTRPLSPSRSGTAARAADRCPWPDRRAGRCRSGRWRCFPRRRIRRPAVLETTIRMRY